MRKSIKKILSVSVCIMLIGAIFAGCSSSASEAQEITDETMLVAYTDENKPFIYKGDDGKLTGFDVEVFEKIFDDIKDEYKNYEFVKVDSDYSVGEDTAYTDKDGNEYIAYIMIGGMQKNTGTVNKDNSFTADTVNNRVITVTTSSTGISNYADLSGKKLGVVTGGAQSALDENSTIKSNAKISVFDNVNDALKNLDSGKVDAVVTDEFSFSVLEGKENYTVLDGALGNTEYAFMFKKGDSLAETVNEAIYELQSPDYNDADEFTPIVEKYFGYDASSFNYVPSDTK